MAIRKSVLTGWGLALALLLFGAGKASAQTGNVTGTVTDQATGAPLAGVYVSIEGTRLSANTQANGRFLILNVPAGSYTVATQLIGYAGMRSPVTVASGGSVTVDFAMRVDALHLEELVVTGVAGQTSKAKLPFTVAKVNVAEIPVPAVSAGAMLQGKVSGVQVVSGSGRPGSTPSILLRGPTSINSTGRNQDPLYIVDGVILGAGMVDIEALDVESIEIVKGAAAASLYGSRAANGVIQITTRRGSTGADGMRFNVRSEYGRSELTGSYMFAKAHRFKMNTAGTKFLTVVEGDTLEVDFGQWNPATGKQYAPILAGGTVWKTFQEHAWPGGARDHVKEFFEPAGYVQNQVSMEGRIGTTNLYTAFSQLDQGGIIFNQGGLDRKTFRLNADQRVGDDVQISASTFYSRSTENAFGEVHGNPVMNLTRMPAGVDLAKRDPKTGEFEVKPDPNEENGNPLEELTKRKRLDNRERFMGALSVRYTPALWFDLDANLSYDRLNVARSDFYPKGFQTARATPSLNNGSTYRDSWADEALNASLTGTFRRTFGELSTRTQFRYLYEATDYNYHRGSAYNLVVDGIDRLDTGREGKLTRSSIEQVRSEGFFAITDFDFRDRYIVSALIRRDGSSLFGPEERWHNYYRGSVAWRLSQEPWFSMPGVNEFKLRYSIGSAGGRPNFSAQYETYSVNDGSVSPQNLGNKDLKPEFALEQEMGFDLAVFNRFNLGLTYASAVVEDQILRVPLPAISGFVNQWKNAGTLESKTLEANLEAILYQSNKLNWSARLVFDRTRQEITELNVPDYQYGIPTIQGLEKVFFARKGEALGTMYGARFAKGCQDLDPGVPCDQFNVNDDGYLVWVGQGKSWKDGLWGTSANFNGKNYFWGTPVPAVIDDEGNTFTKIGKTTPDFTYSISNTLNYQGFTVYGLLDAVRGVNVYNLPRHWSTFQHYNGEADQTGKSPETKKPIGYYSALYNGLSPANQHFMEDGGYLKLRELSLSYTFKKETLARLGFLSGTDRLSINLIGRNLHTWTKYTGFDPEVGITGGDVGSAVIARFDGFTYPKFRTWTASVDISF